MFDDNQGNQPELEAPEETLSMEQVEDTNEGDLERSFFWACPVCMTDAHLQDVTEL